MPPVTAGRSGGPPIADCSRKINMFRKFEIDGNIFWPWELKLFHVCGDSADPFDIHDGNVIIGSKEESPNIGDLLILEIFSGDRAGELKLREFISQEDDNRWKTRTFEWEDEACKERKERIAYHEPESYVATARKVVINEGALF